MGIHPAILRRRGGGSFYGVLGNEPALVADMVRDTHRNAGVRQTFDTTFTTSRLGNATMVDSDGLIKWAPHNLLRYSEDFSNVAWTKSGVTATVGSIVEDTSTGNHRILPLNGIAVTTVSHTVSIDVKPAGRTRVKLTNNNLFGTTYDLVGSGSVVSGSGDITVLDGGWYRISTSATSSTTERLVLYLDDGTGLSYTGDGVSGVEIRHAHLYRSDLGGMAPVPSDARVAGSTTYVPTTSTAKYLPRRHNHTYNGSAWVDAGTLIETEARTQLLHTTNALVTQSHTVTAVPHTLHFTGTGTVTLSGASTAGPLVGTGTGEENRVSLTFTPTAASLTLTVTGTVTDAQLEVGSTPSSYIPNLAGSGTVTRAAETSGLTVDSSIVPWGSAVCIQMKGRMTYADTGVGVAVDGITGEVMFASWRVDSSNYIALGLSTGGPATGQPVFLQEVSGVFDFVNPAGSPYSPGINVPFNIASRHGSIFINGAVDGTALTADTTPVALPDLSSTDLQIGYDFMGNIEEVRLWVVDIGDTGLEASTT